MYFLWGYLVMVLIRPQEYVPLFQNFPYMPILLLGATLAWLIGSKAKEAPQNFLVFAFLLVTCFSRVANGWTGGGVFWFGKFAPVVLIFYLIASTANTLDRLRFFMATVIVCATVMAVHGMDQVARGVGWTGSEMIMGRITYLGVFNDPNDLGMLFVVALPMALYLLKRAGGIKKLFWLSCTGSLLYGVLLTNSRGTMLAAIMIFGLIILRKRGPFVAALLAIPGVLGLMVVAPSRLGQIDSQEESAAGRVDAWYEAIQMFKMNPLFGVGANQFTDYHHLTAHNSFFLVLAEAGLPGFMLFSALIGYSLLMTRRMSLINPAQAQVAAVPTVSGGVKGGLGGPGPLGQPEEGPPDATRAEYRELGFTMLLSMLAFCATAFFLSRAYAMLLYILLGLVVASYVLARKNVQDLPRYRFSQDFFAWSVASAFGALGLFLVVKVLLMV